MKFGGTSVSTIERWNTIVQRCEAVIQEGHRPFVVCSALNGISNILERVVLTAPMGQHARHIEEVRRRHKTLTEALGLSFDETCAPMLADLERIATGCAMVGEVSLKQQARIMSSGELLSTTMGAAFLSKMRPTQWLDARRYMKSETLGRLDAKSNYLEAFVRPEHDEILQGYLSDSAQEIYITQGFVGSNRSNDTVLLGRGGSDTSATHFAAKLSAVRCEIWTDVPGMFTANPRKVPNARLLNRLSYEEAQEIASTGAKVLHPRCIPPAKRFEIPVTIRCTSAPHMPSTLIDNTTAGTGSQVKAMSARMGITLISMETIGMWQQVGFLSDVFQEFKRHGVSIDLVSTSETNVTVSLDPGSIASDSQEMATLLKSLNGYCTAHAIGPCAAVSVVGTNIRGLLHRLGPALEVFEEQAIHLVSQAANDLNITFVVEENQAERLVSMLHQLLISNQEPTEFMGPTWEELFETAADGARVERSDRWWLSRRKELTLLGAQTPAYLYHLPTVRTRAQGLKSVKSLNQVFYAMKANSNPKILMEVYNSGIGFECVSPGEVQRVFDTLPNISPDRILFTPNFAPREDYVYGFQKGIHVTLDNIHPLEAWPDVFTNKDIIVRMDPGQGKGHHQHVRTAGARSKFGISVGQIPRLQAAAKKINATVVGLHAHSGSGIRNPENWKRVGLFLGKIAEQFSAVRHIDVGGGLGVVEKSGEIPLDLDSLNEALTAVKTAYPQLEIWMEPGRYLVAEAGVLLVQVTQLKTKGSIQYVGVNAGMNALIRPALYGSWHNIINLTNYDAPNEIVANVVGPICESGDTLGRDRKLPKTGEGDIFLIDVAGAYGYCMSSKYNLRGQVRELVLE